MNECKHPWCSPVALSRNGMNRNIRVKTCFDCGKEIHVRKEDMPKSTRKRVYRHENIQNDIEPNISGNYINAIYCF